MTALAFFAVAILSIECYTASLMVKDAYDIWRGKIVS